MSDIEKQITYIHHIVNFLIEPNIVEVKGLVHYRKDVAE
jgi:hypothetical protein